MMINIPDELVKQLEEIALKEHRSVEDVVVGLVKAQLPSEQPEDSSIEALIGAFDEVFADVELPNDDIDEVVANSREILHDIMNRRLSKELGNDEV